MVLRMSLAVCVGVRVRVGERGHGSVMWVRRRAVMRTQMHVRRQHAASTGDETPLCLGEGALRMLCRLQLRQDRRMGRGEH